MGALCAVSMASAPGRDGIVELLDALAAAYEAFPDLWLDLELRCAAVAGLHLSWSPCISTDE